MIFQLFLNDSNNADVPPLGAESPTNWSFPTISNIDSEETGLSFAKSEFPSVSEQFSSSSVALTRHRWKECLAEIIWAGVVNKTLLFYRVSGLAPFESSFRLSRNDRLPVLKATSLRMVFLLWWWSRTLSCAGIFIHLLRFSC